MMSKNSRKQILSPDYNRNDWTVSEVRTTYHVHLYYAGRRDDMVLVLLQVAVVSNTRRRERMTA